MNIDIVMIFFMRKQSLGNKIRTIKFPDFAKLWLHPGGTIVTS